MISRALGDENDCSKTILEIETKHIDKQEESKNHIVIIHLEHVY